MEGWRRNRRRERGSEPGQPEATSLLIVSGFSDCFCFSVAPSLASLRFSNFLSLFVVHSALVLHLFTFSLSIAFSELPVFSVCPSSLLCLSLHLSFSACVTLRSLCPPTLCPSDSRPAWGKVVGVVVSRGLCSAAVFTVFTAAGFISGVRLNSTIY